MQRKQQQLTSELKEINLKPVLGKGGHHQVSWETSAGLEESFQIDTVWLRGGSCVTNSDPSTQLLVNGSMSQGWTSVQAPTITFAGSSWNFLLYRHFKQRKKFLFKRFFWPLLLSSLSSIFFTQHLLLDLWSLSKQWFQDKEVHTWGSTKEELLDDTGHIHWTLDSVQWTLDTYTGHSQRDSSMTDGNESALLIFVYLYLKM